MRTWHRSLCAIFILSFLITILLGALATQSRADDGQMDFQMADLNDDVVRQDGLVNVGLWVINVYDFEYAKGNYVFDYYIYFYWTDNNITKIDWFMMNGRPSIPGTKELVANGTNDGINYQYFRVRADLSIPLEAGNYPFEPVKLPISIEIVNPGYPIDLRWMQNSSGVDPGFKIVGWKVVDTTYQVNDHQYPFNISTPQAVMNIIITPEMFVVIPDFIIPPLIFCLVSAFSFLLRMDDSSAFGLRVGLNTSMLITAVLFYISTQSKIPPTSQLNFYTLFNTAVFAFLAINLIVTILGYVQFNYHKDPAKLKKVNVYGIILSILVPLCLMSLLFFV